MKKSPLPLPSVSGLHVAIIMDGNGRWAVAHGKPRGVGHRVGARAARRIVETAPRLGITTLTVYMFSADNWERPQREVATLMRLLKLYLRAEIGTCLTNGVRISVIGKRDDLAPDIRAAVETAEATTAHCSLLHLRVAVNYSARSAILRAARCLPADTEPTRETFSRLLGLVDHDQTPAPDVDLLIRTGGEQRLSDFLLWECAYAELFFSPRMWPDFTEADLDDAVGEFHRRERRFGRVPQAVSS